MPVAMKLHASLVVQLLSVPCHSRLSPTSLLSGSCKSPRRQQRQQSRQQGGRQQGARQRGSHRWSQHQRKLRPHCAYDRCEKSARQWESTCLQKARDIRGRRDASKRDRSTSPRCNPRRFHGHHRDDNEEDNNADEEAGNTHGDKN